MPMSQKLLAAIWVVSFVHFGVGVEISSAQIWFNSLKWGPLVQMNVAGEQEMNLGFRFRTLQSRGRA